MTAGRWLLAVLTLVLVGSLIACVPESDLERASGGSGGDDDAARRLTPIPESSLPELPELELRVLSVELERGADRVAAVVTLGAGAEDRIELAGTGTIEWSDGEVTDALPMPAEELTVESRRDDPSGDVVPASLVLSNISWRPAFDPDAEITRDEIITEWGTFPVLSIENASRPPGFHLNYQAAGQRWVSRAEVRRSGPPEVATGSSGSFDDEFRPLTGSLRFGPEFDDLEADLPLPARVDIRVAVKEMRIELN